MNQILCKNCVLPHNYSFVEFDEQGICSICNKKEQTQKKSEFEVQNEFRNEDELKAILQKHKRLNKKYDLLIPASGGLDSSKVIITAVEKFNLRPLVFHNDHGYEDKTATQNVINLCHAINVDMIILHQDISFMKKLWKYINETDISGLNSCYVCGNILFLNSLELADTFDIPIVINGYSKGQAAMTNDKDLGVRVLESLLQVLENVGDKEFSEQFLAKYKILDKKIDYRSKTDLINKIPENKILFIPFFVFKFYKTDKAKLKKEIISKFNWQAIKHSYPGRSTNCDMVWLNTYCDKIKNGYSLYDIEYAELVRKNEMTREQAISDLAFNPPPGCVDRLASEINLNLDRLKP